MRNFYGKWNEERWLRSTFIKDYKLNKARPEVTVNAKTYAASNETPESYYDKKVIGGKVMANDRKEAQSHIPQTDPWRQTLDQPFNAGVDFRWFYVDTNKDKVKTKGAMPMATDIGVSFNPIEHVNAVWESRFLSDPRATSVWDQAYTKSAGVRSAYVLADDFSYNSYAMYGIYRPMFGHYDPDHTTLLSRVTGLGYDASFKAAGVGFAPGRAFFNLNYLEPFTDRSLAQDRGFVLNGGIHFGVAGAYAMVSLWDTSVKDWTANTTTRRKMNAVTGGFTKGGLTTIVDITHLVIATPTVRTDSGTVITLEPRYRLWKENYLKLAWEYVNTGPTLRLGHAREIAGGFSSYIASGTEVELMYSEMKATELDIGTTERNVWAQVHLYF